MCYRIEKYKNCERFNEQYEDIYSFLLEAECLEFNEHFHWGRFEWMHVHSMLDEDKLTEITMFRDENGGIAGLLTYDTNYNDRVYLIHTSSDKELLNQMIDAACEKEDCKVVIRVNSKDTGLLEVLQERQFERKHKDVSVLALDLCEEREYSIPEGYLMSPRGFVMDNWQYQLVIHKGFNHEGLPDKWPDEVFAGFAYATNRNAVIQTFALAQEEYCAHCGLWYTEGNTAYVEPVVTIPQHRKQGLAKAVIYEACMRARARGAKRATVLSDREFYYRIGFECSSEVYCWEKEK